MLFQPFGDFFGTEVAGKCLKVPKKVQNVRHDCMKKDSTIIKKKVFEDVGCTTKMWRDVVSEKCSKTETFRSYLDVSSIYRKSVFKKYLKNRKNSVQLPEKSVTIIP